MPHPEAFPRHPRTQGGAGCSPAGGPGQHLGQSGDLDETLEVQHVGRSSEEVPEAVGQMGVREGPAGRQPHPHSHAQAMPTALPPLVPVKLLVEPVPVALQGVRRETWVAQAQ